MLPIDPPSYAKESYPEPPKYSSTPPPYNATLRYFGLTLMKIELNTPYEIVQNREWQPVLLELNTTQLNVYSLNVERRLYDLILALFHEENSLENLMYRISKNKVDSKKPVDELEIMFGDAYGVDDSHNFNKSASTAVKETLKKYKLTKSLKDLKDFYMDLKENNMLFEAGNIEWDFQQFKTKYCGDRIHSWTLHKLQVGEAPSILQVISSLYKEDDLYKNQNFDTLQKCKNVLRVRVELKQVLFQFWSFYGMVHWYRNLKIGRDLSSDIDYRLLGKLKSIPRRNNRENNALLVAASEAAGLSSLQESDEQDNLFYNQFSREKNVYNQEDNQIINNLETSEGSDSVEISIFDTSPTLNSLGTGTTSSSSINCPTKTYQTEYKLVSLSKYYIDIEQQYISNCISNLNSFEVWVGKSVTILNYRNYLDTKSILKLKDTSNYQELDLLITKSLLNVEKGFFRKKKRHNSIDIQKNGGCRSFLVHENGLVGLALKEKPLNIVI